MRFRPALLPFVLVAIAGVTAFADEPLRFEITRDDGTRHEGVAVLVADREVTFVVAHGSGIGRARIRTPGPWPGAITLRFEKFPALEGFHTRNARVRTEARLGFGEKRSTGPFEKYSIPGDGEPRSDEPTGKTAITLVREGRHIIVRVPGDVLPEPGGTLHVDWVDAYRG